MTGARNKPHNEWFRTIKKRKCECGERNVQVYSWGEYVRVKWYTVMHFCETCYVYRAEPLLIKHIKDCGCSFHFQWKGHGPMPQFLQDSERKINESGCRPKGQVA